MAPKKSETAVNGSPNGNKQKKPKVAKKKPKVAGNPKTKIKAERRQPTIVKVKITTPKLSALQKNREDAAKFEAINKKKKITDPEEKIELANDVIRRQLGQPTPAVPTISTSPKSTVKKKAIKKKSTPVSKGTITSYFFSDKDTKVGKEKNAKRTVTKKKAPVARKKAQNKTKAKATEELAKEIEARLVEDVPEAQTDAIFESPKPKKTGRSNSTKEETEKSLKSPIMNEQSAKPTNTEPGVKKQMRCVKTKKEGEKKPPGIIDPLTALRNFGNSPSSPLNISKSPAHFSRKPSNASDNFDWIKEISSSATSVTSVNSTDLSRVLSVHLVDIQKVLPPSVTEKLLSNQSVQIKSPSPLPSPPVRPLQPVKRKILYDSKINLTIKRRRDTDGSSGTVTRKKSALKAIVDSESEPVSPLKSLSPTKSLNLSVSTTTAPSVKSKSPEPHKLSVSVKSEKSNASSTISQSSAKSDLQQREIVLRNLKQIFSCIDMEYINWLGSVKDQQEVTVDDSKLQRIPKKMHLEGQYLASKELHKCRRRMSNSSAESNKETNVSSIKTPTSQAVLVNTIKSRIQSPKKTTNNADENQPTDTTKVINDEPCTVEETINDTNRIEPEAVPNNVPISPEPPRRLSYDPNATNDDDDALSLYAESFTGIESTKYGSNHSYLPPVSPLYEPNYPDEVDQNVVTRPTVNKTIKEANHDNVVQKNFVQTRTEIREDVGRTNKTICEKQNADSTSVREELRLKITSEDRDCGNFAKGLISCSDCQPMSFMRSIVFKGVCFFNLYQNCKKNRCMFPHVDVSTSEVAIRLQRVTDKVFVSEYLLLNNHTPLLNKYLSVFVEECLRRGLSRILVEMSMDASELDCDIKVHAIESTLLRLNNADFEYCNDLLRAVYLPSTHLVCEEYMHTIACTLNFSRFKNVFKNLVNFIIANGKPFDIDDSEKIVERLSILTYEDSLADSAIRMIKNTPVDILKVSAMDMFLKRLRYDSPARHEDLTLWRNQCLGIGNPVFLNVPPPPLPRKNLELVQKPPEGNKRYTSPDTTHLDTMGNQEAPRVTRVIDTSGSRARTYISNLQIKVPTVLPSCSNGNTLQHPYRTTESIFHKVHRLVNGNRPNMPPSYENVNHDVFKNRRHHPDGYRGPPST